MTRAMGQDKPGEGTSGAVSVADAGAAALVSGRLDELRDPEQAGWQRVKSNVSRTVYRRSINGRGLYLKHYHPRSAVYRLARRLGASDARCEMRFIQYLAGRGVATPPALASMCDGQTEWLLTEAVEPSQQADRWHAEQLGRGAEGRSAVRRATVALGRLVGRMHAAGVIHRDLHCGNVLVRGEAGDPEVVLMDLHRVRRRRRLSRRARAANLAQLLHDRREFTTRTDRLRFLKAYLAAGGAAGSMRGWQLLVEQFARAHTGRQHAQRERRARGTNKYFCRLRLARGWRGHVVLASKRRMAGSQAAGMELSADAWRQALGRPEALFEEGGEVVKDSPSSQVIRRRLTVGDREVDVYVKRTRRKHAWKLLADCLRPSRPIRAFRKGHALLARHIATALPLAALERRRGPFLADSILITEAAAGTMLGPFLNTWLASPPRGDTPLSVVQQRQLAQDVLWQLGRMVQKLHDSSFAHRDLKASNILVQWSAPTAPLEVSKRDKSRLEPRVVLLDLDGLSRKRYLSLSRRFQGLMRLNVSLLNCPVVNRAGRLRMLLGYLRRPGCGRIDFKPYWRVLEDWSTRKLQRQIRSRRKRQKADRRPGS
ncbi:MAG TPA: lipopolysaccharide kinase InaA family protein [Phycisphaerae bacterium]|nr:lipopolysaccharide kinase InaA family protein [Phycisphaerae bacterium]